MAGVEAMWLGCANSVPMYSNRHCARWVVGQDARLRQTRVHYDRRKFGDSVRSKGEQALQIEVLARLVGHNLCCLISAMYEMGVNPVFWIDQAQAG